MNKYDCSKFLDLRHEQKRVCASYNICSDGCPLKDYNCMLESIGQEEIDILQKWSDEHPEASKLTKKDITFLECFMGTVDRRISRDGDCVFYQHGGVSNLLSSDMFEAVKPNTVMTFEELLELEVED